MVDLKQTVSTISQSVVSQTSGLLKSAKLSLQLANEQSRLKDIYVEIGKQVHEIYAYGGTIGPFFDEKYKAVVEVETKIADIKNRMAEKSKKPDPPSPGQPDPSAPETDIAPQAMSAQAVTEPSIPAQAMPSQVIPPENPPCPPPQPGAKVCGVCGAENEAAEKYCLSCGRML